MSLTQCSLEYLLCIGPFVPDTTRLKVKCGREVRFRASLVFTNDSGFTDTHAHMHTYKLTLMKAWSLSYLTNLFLLLLRSCPVFCPIVNKTFSLLNNSFSIKCWQPNWGSLEYFESALVDEIQKSLATMAVAERTWAPGTDRHGLKSGFNYLFTMWPWESFLTLRVQVSFLWYTKSPE